MPSPPCATGRGEALCDVGTAQEIVHEDTTGELLAYVSCLDNAELVSTLGEVMLFLARTSGRPQHAATAVDPLTTAAAPRALFVVGDIDAARDAGHRARRVATAVDSARVRRRFLDLAHDTAPHELPAVRAPREQLLAANSARSPRH